MRMASQVTCDDVFAINAYVRLHCCYRQAVCSMHGQVTTNFQGMYRIQNVQNEAKYIAKKLNLADRVNTTAEREAFSTLKYHKLNFQNITSCRLVNPSKSAKISKRS